MRAIAMPTESFISVGKWSAELRLVGCVRPPRKTLCCVRCKLAAAHEKLIIQNSPRIIYGSNGAAEMDAIETEQPPISRLLCKEFGPIFSRRALFQQEPFRWVQDLAFFIRVCVCNSASSVLNIFPSLGHCSKMIIMMIIYPIYLWTRSKVYNHFCPEFPKLFAH